MAIAFTNVYLLEIFQKVLYIELFHMSYMLQ